MYQLQHYDSISTKIAAEFRKYQDLIINEEYGSARDYIYPRLPEYYANYFFTYESHKNEILIRYNRFFNAIEKMIKYDSKYLIEYSRTLYYYDYYNIDSVISNKNEHGYAVSLDNGNNWFFLESYGFIEVKNSLKKDFDPFDIEYVLTLD